MIVPKSGGVYKYCVDGVDYRLTVVDHSMFIAPCTVKIEFEGREVIRQITYSNLIKFFSAYSVTEVEQE